MKVYDDFYECMDCAVEGLNSGAEKKDSDGS